MNLVERGERRRPLGPPQYRIEHRRGDEPALIVAFADTEITLRAALAQRVAHHLRTRTGGTLVAIDQASDEVVTVRDLPSHG